LIKQGNNETKTQFNKRVEDLNRAVRESFTELCGDNSLQIINPHMSAGGKSLRITFVNSFRGNFDLTYPSIGLGYFVEKEGVPVETLDNILGDKLVIMFSREASKVTDLVDVFYIILNMEINKKNVKKRIKSKLKSEGVGIDFIKDFDVKKLNKSYLSEKGNIDRIELTLPENHPFKFIKDFTPFIKFVQKYAAGVYEKEF